MTEGRLVAATLALVALALLAFAASLRPPARLAPVAVLLPTCGLLLLEAGRLWRRTAVPPPRAAAARALEARRATRPIDGTTGRRARELTFVAWLSGLVAGSLLLGAGLALPLFLFLWLVAQARRGWLVAMAVAAPAALLVDVLLPRGFGIRLPAGLIGAVLVP
ncbi:MAG TPA: hypothetical protein VFG43_07765 [Geminicoccaceae bacterium]|nr:hypothetical protein [Geminicoccaceae bacterium]